MMNLPRCSTLLTLLVTLCTLHMATSFSGTLQRRFTSTTPPSYNSARICNKVPLFASSDLSSRPRWYKRLYKSLHPRIKQAAMILALVTIPIKPANAKFSYELHDTPTTSLRPGMNRVQADSIESGDLSRAEIEELQKQTTSTDSPGTTHKQTKLSKSKQTSLYGDEDDEEDFFMDSPVAAKATAADKTFSSNLHAVKSNQFASYNKGGKSTALTLKVGAAIFIPTFGGQVLREHIRRKREEVYVKKGLEVLEAQKAEYFNVTSKTADSDVEDELKKIKNDDDDDDDDDSDDEDDDEDDSDDDSDDDDDDDEPVSRRRPPLPKPPKGGPSSGGSDPGYGKPSAEDLDRLNKMFGKS